MITASVVTYNHHYEDIEEVIKSLIVSHFDRIYVIDHSDKMSDLPREIEKEVLEKDIIYLRHENNGYGGGHNVAIRDARAAGSSYHLVVNPDVRFDSDVIPALKEYMDNHPTVGQMMPKVLYFTGEVQRLAKMLPTPLDLIGRFFLPRSVVSRRNNIFELRDSGFAHTLNVPYLSGCFMFLRMSALDDVGLFDENFFMYAEDIDLTRRIHKHYETLYYPEVFIYHKFSRGSRHDFRLFYIHVINIFKYFNKWGWWKDSEREEMNAKLKQQIKECCQS